MNKLEVSTEELRENVECLELKENRTYYIQKQIKIKQLDIPANVKNTKIVIEKNAGLICGCIVNIKNIETKITIESKENSTLLLQLGIHASKNNDLTIENLIEENNCKNTIRIRVVGEENSNTLLRTIGNMKKDTLEIEFTEDIKYLSEKTSKIECLPELLVASKDTLANHFLSIGTVSEEELFYLEAKGIKKEVACNLIRECFIKSMLIGEEG